MTAGRRLPALAGTAAGVAAAVVLTLLQSSSYRADASIVLVGQGKPPGSDPALAQAAEAAAGLFHSRAVAEPAVANLRLKESADELLDRFSVEPEPKSSLVRIAVDASSRGEARRTAQELTEIATVLFNDRFAPGTLASVWEAPRAEQDRVSPKPVRNLALGALAGAALGQLLVLLLGRPRRPTRTFRAGPAPVRLPQPERGPVPGPEPERAAQPAPQPEPKPEAEPVISGPFVRPRLGEWTIADVERLLTQEGPRYPDRVAELAWYVETFRDVAEADGRLPGGVDIVVEDVFGDLIASAAASVPQPSEES